MSLVPIFAGLYGMVMGLFMFGVADFIQAQGMATDSHFRYLSGLLFTIGILFWYFLPNITEHKKVISYITLMVFIGGLNRLLFAVYYGEYSILVVLPIVMELIITPLIYWWIVRVHKIEMRAKL